MTVDRTIHTGARGSALTPLHRQPRSLHPAALSRPPPLQLPPRSLEAPHTHTSEAGAAGPFAPPSRRWTDWQWRGEEEAQGGLWRPTVNS